MVVALVIVAMVAAVTLAAGFYVRRLDSVFPNVSLGGVKLAGMSLYEAELALIDAGYEENAANISATLSFPNGESLRVSGEEAGMKLNASDAARLALEYGRDGSPLSCMLNYIKCRVSSVELTSPENLTVDEEYVRSVTDAATADFNSGLLRGAYTVNSNDIVVVKGAGSALADREETYALTIEMLYESARINEPVSAEYSIPANPAGDVDLDVLRREIFREPVSAVYDPDTQGVTESVTGVDFDVNDARLRLESADTGERIVIPLIITPPEVASEQLESLLFRDILAERTTNIAGTSNRLTNVTLASEAIDGTVLNPGDDFSFNGIVGQRTEAKGYKSAGAYAGGMTVQEIGGGICQVSSTIYDCVLHTDLEVVTRSNHMFVVTYLPYGNDATINWGTIDFKFKNNTDYPIRLELVVADRKLTVKLHGTKLDTGYIKTDYVTISTTGYDTEEVEDPSIEPGTTKVDTAGHGGLVVETYKYYYDEGGTLLNKTYVSRSSYRAQNRIVLVPVGTLDPDPNETPPTDDPNSPPSGEPTPPPEETPTATPTPTPTAEPTPTDTPPTTETPTEPPTDPSDDPPDWLPEA
ncbi:MAG: VanW family protein [Clostridiales Family XIII bacterium]|nr:VanW family protein [Clostridiales Family XIII bacterium]